MKFILFALCFSLLCIFEVVSASNKRRIQYSYSLWVGDEIERKFSVNLKSNDGIFFIDGMYEAADKSPHFRFDATDSSDYGKFITKIGDYANNLDKSNYWMLYIYNMTSKPNERHKPGNNLLSPFGVSSLRVEDKHHYLFWLKTVKTVI